MCISYHCKRVSINSVYKKKRSLHTLNFWILRPKSGCKITLVRFSCNQGTRPTIYMWLFSFFFFFSFLQNNEAMQADILLCTQYCHFILILCLSRLACLHCLTHYCSTKWIIIPWGFIFGQFVRYCFCCVGMAPSRVKRERSDKAVSTTCMCTCTMDRQTNKRSCYLVPSALHYFNRHVFLSSYPPKCAEIKNYKLWEYANLEAAQAVHIL